jgi:hypothetical protein
MNSMIGRIRAGFPFGASALGGLAVCLSVTARTGRTEAWDSPLYFSTGIPVMCVLIFIVAYFYPARAWRWTLSMAAGQAVALAFSGNSLSLWPLAIIAMTMVSAPQFICGLAASKLAIHVRNR